MANPQKENGYTVIANEVIEQLAFASLSGREMRVVLVVIRKTWGWSKKEDRLSLSQVAEATGIARPHISGITRGLVAKGFLVVKGATTGGNIPNTYYFNKNHDLWGVQGGTVRGTTRKEIGGTVRGTGVVPPVVTQVVPSTVPLVAPSTVPPQIVKVARKSRAKPKNKVVPSTVPTKQVKERKETAKERATPKASSTSTPAGKATLFFRGVETLMMKGEVPWLKQMLANIHAKNADITKIQIWNEVRSFGMYWSERNGTGTKERWQLQKTFEVEKRLETWFRKTGLKHFQATGSPKGKKIIGLND